MIFRLANESIRFNLDDHSEWCTKLLCRWLAFSVVVVVAWNLLLLHFHAIIVHLLNSSDFCIELVHGKVNEERDRAIFKSEQNFCLCDVNLSPFALMSMEFYLLYESGIQNPTYFPDRKQQFFQSIFCSTIYSNSCRCKTSICKNRSELKLYNEQRFPIKCIKMIEFGGVFFSIEYECFSVFLFFGICWQQNHFICNAI